VPRNPEPRWGFAKVTRKSGAFANSIAVAVARDQMVTVVLAAAAVRPLRMSKAGALAATGTELALREAIAADLAMEIPDADSYQRRLHTATILRALRELRCQ
jgi:aerobic carbon-monoxide dehydrogenase medium subunit